MVDQIPVSKLYDPEQKIFTEELEKIKMMKEYDETVIMAIKNAITGMQNMLRDKEDKKVSNGKGKEDGETNATDEKDPEHRSVETPMRINGIVKAMEGYMELASGYMKEFDDDINQLEELLDEYKQRVAKYDAYKDLF